MKAVHWSDIGEPTAPDKEIMEFAVGEGYVVFAQDLDFGRLLAAQRSNAPSVVQMRTQDVLPAKVGAIVVNALNAARSHLATGVLVTIDPVQHRIRLLPI